MSATKDTYVCPKDAVTVTIAVGESESDGVDLGGLRLKRVNPPEGWTTAWLALQVDDGDGWRNLRGAAGNKLVLKVDEDDPTASIDFMSSVFSSISKLRLCSINSGTGAAEPQAAKRSIQLILGGN